MRIESNKTHKKHTMAPEQGCESTASDEEWENDRLIALYIVAIVATLVICLVAGVLYLLL